jgi:hypothetical protein
MIIGLLNFTFSRQPRFPLSVRFMGMSVRPTPARVTELLLALLVCQDHGSQNVSDRHPESYAPGTNKSETKEGRQGVPVNLVLSSWIHIQRR